MTPGLWFSLVLRVLGVWQLITVTSELAVYLNINLGLYRPTTFDPRSALIDGFVNLLVGGVLLIWAPLIAAHFYPPSAIKNKVDDTQNE